MFLLPARRMPDARRRKAIFEVEHATLAEALQLFRGTLKLKGAKAEIADKVVREIRSRLKFLNDVGLTYLSLDRSADTLERRRGPAHPSGQPDRQWA